MEAKKRGSLQQSAAQLGEAPPHLGSWIESSGAAQEKEKSRRKVQIGGSAEKELSAGC